MASSISINIGGGEDAFNRYKMPPVIGKVEGKGNGIKTRIDNCFEVARALHRPPGYVCKFFGCELGALTQIDDETRLYIVNGAFDDRILAETLKKFINMFVLCAKCNLPETDMKVKKNGDIVQNCNACGATSLCDMSHKLCTYIVNNPPDGKKKSAANKASKAERRAKKAKAAAGATGDGETAEDAAANDDKARRRAARAAARGATKGDSAAASADGSVLSADSNGHLNGNKKTEDEEDDDGVQWSVDMSKEAADARRRDIGAAAAILERTTLVDVASLAEKLRAYIEDGKKPSKVVAKAAKLFDGEENAVRGIIAAAVVGESATSVKASIKSIAFPTLSAHFGCPMNGKAQKDLLLYFEHVAAKDPEALKLHPYVLEAVYDMELVEEESILAWFNDAKVSDDVKNAVRSIVEWLENADEEGEDEEDEEDE